MIDNIIFDVGMHNGDDTAYYLHKGFRVIAVEADPTLAAQGQTRFASAIAQGRLQIANVGIASEPGTLPFYLCESHTEWNSFDPQLASRHGQPSRRIDIPCKRFKDLLNEFGVPFYLKVDIEGYDHLCLSDLNSDDLPRYVSVEATSESLLETMRDLGYNGFKCISQQTFACLGPEGSDARTPPVRQGKVRRLMTPALQGLYKVGFLQPLMKAVHRRLQVRRINDYSFYPGSSGPFGEDTPGPWLPLADTLALFRRHLQCVDTNDPSIWLDFHARKA